MTTPEQADKRARRPRAERVVLDWPFLAINAGVVLALVAVAAIAAWPIYSSTNFVVLVIVSTVLAIAISFVSLLRGFSWLTTILVTLATYLVVGVPLAVPSALAGFSTIVSGWLDLLTASVFGWKELVTISIPVGAYQSLLVPALIVFLGGTVTALSFAWRSKKLYFLALPALFLMLLFGIAFGSSDASDRADVAGLAIIAPREFGLGLIAFLIGFGFLIWRVQHARRQALRSAQVTAGIRQARPAIASLVRRIALAAVIVLVAIAGSAALTPAIGEAKEREVLRTTVERDINLREYVSPLTQYRSYFESDLYDAELFTIESDAPLESRLRLAVLSYYDGQVYRVVDPNQTEAVDESSFVRVPYRLEPASGGTEQSVTIGVGNYSGVWVPTVGELIAANFTGDDSAEMADGFYYNTATESAIELATLGEGDSFELDAVVSPPNTDLAALGAPAVAADSSNGNFPKSLVDWVKAQNDITATDGEQVAQLIERLRARGYLSHAIGTSTDEDNTEWVAGLGADYVFKQSLAGHSADRIGALFQSLLDKQNSTTDTEDIQLVSAVGDDEQFAVAAALLASYLGYESRVVLGFGLGEAVDAEAAIQPCAEDVCRGRDLTAWVEIKGSDDTWHTADATPQYKNALDPVNKNTRDPENGTAVSPDTATDQLPPDSNPSSGDGNNQNQQRDGVDLEWLVTTLKIVGISLLALLIVLAPFITILVAKARRRKDRRTADKVESRIVGGWDEYVDAALDHGRATPGSETRVELARSYESPRGVELATIADRAVFGAVDPDESESERFWQIVEQERLSFSAGMTRWQRWKAALSLRSFTRYLGTQLASQRAKGTGKGNR